MSPNGKATDYKSVVPGSTPGMIPRKGRKSDIQGQF